MVSVMCITLPTRGPPEPVKTGLFRPKATERLPFGGVAPREVTVMTGPLCTMLSGCALAMLFVASTASAANGRIVFSGAVVEPTCSTFTADVDAETTVSSRPVDGSGQHRLSCGRTPTNPGRSYSRTVVSLDVATISNDRLLGYFASYSNADGGAAAKLVTRTYE